jgi:hypothetical protein
MTTKKTGRLIRFPEHRPRPPELGTFSYELPVCVANRKDVRQEAIEIAFSEHETWRMSRGIDHPFPAPEHYKYWLWFLSKCHHAAISGSKQAPAIEVDFAETEKLFGSMRFEKGLPDIEEAFLRFANLLLSFRADIVADEMHYLGFGSLGALCRYISWRTTDQHENRFKRQVIPGHHIWMGILNEEIQCPPIETIRRLPSYVSQRLCIYLRRHCEPGGQHRVPLKTLLPRIPMTVDLAEAKNTLMPHHKALVQMRFLASEPKFAGRGADKCVVYERL